MWNPFKKTDDSDKQTSDDLTVSKKDDRNDNLEGALPKMNMLQRMAMKRIEKMSPAEQQKMMQEAFKPENKGKLLAAMEMMKKTGQITDEQYEQAKQKLGL